MSHAKTMGHMTPNNPHPKDSAIFWTGLRICKNRVLNITKKRGLEDNITNCLKINKRQEWVNHLLKQSQLTSSGRYSERRVNKIEKKMPKKLSLLKHVDLKQAIAEIITNPNKNWKKLKREKYITEKSYFKNNHHKSKTIRHNRLFCNSYVEPFCNPHVEQVEIKNM
jgi:hypothetical protein